ncbi:UDP-N-acetylmuramoyl-L-alanyl-D-glutamate--2,6-diaminopimelate ligase [Brumicola pallidula]|jgi:UDP-N-acetylmuramoyl-L-alanyl-D-glutamate--2,6-diaminopimelate ligase|uniref:UDP-N-acetylmuramyl-tripeptide synthetase n=1 Tax=Brumicola pallidula DSM 14239 = ACAM 615 TaxID=1121922 RepID=K6ZKM3_9ALTE|nr:UDP-N-acetylmuramoyl-L-alanyl-D-glutamate--2,6-diaminopimelate ligase [Glaciecola pallidula]GAC30867.1 UDP-N-acetylmuramoylalanyl-D-glutamate--2,6-diaminopimelate ligase [Glaciecola pallidula DSM 14239 = ACAM 615]
MPSNEDKLQTRSIASILAIFDILIAATEVDNIVLDSRSAKHNSLFIAHQGTSNNGAKYVQGAINNGAKLVLVNTNNTEQHGQVDSVGEALIISFFELEKQIGFICSAFHQHVSNTLQCVAITGTNGKTSVAHICAQLSASCGENAGTIGTMGVGFYPKKQAPIKILDTINTTPDIACMHQFAHLVKQLGGRRLCIEASSHGLHQKRLSGFKVDVAAFTNLTQDHLDYHPSLNEYAKAKRLLLKQDGIRYLVLNADDKESHRWVEQAPEHTIICLCSVNQRSSASLLQAYAKHNQHYKYCIALNPRFTPNGSTFKIKSSWGQASVSLPLIGQFNIANLLTAFSSLLLQGVSFERLVDAVPLLNGVPGRMEVFESIKHGNIIVDYAHTPDALEQALLAARQHVTGKLTVIFGCGGDRDNSKRSQMGKIAELCADEVILTQDNSRNELPEDIIADIQQGIHQKSKLKIELERTSAIKQAYLNSCTDDLIVVAGKGHEEYLELKSVREHYNEREYVKQLTMEVRG